MYDIVPLVGREDECLQCPLTISFAHPYSVVVVHTLLTIKWALGGDVLENRDIAQLGVIHRVHIVQGCVQAMVIAKKQASTHESRS